MLNYILSLIGIDRYSIKYVPEPWGKIMTLKLLIFQTPSKTNYMIIYYNNWIEKLIYE